MKSCCRFLSSRGEIVELYGAVEFYGSAPSPGARRRIQEIAMASEKEIALKQALVAVLSASKDLGVGEQVVEMATAGLVSDDPRYRWLERTSLNSAVL